MKSVVYKLLYNSYVECYIQSVVYLTYATIYENADPSDHVVWDHGYKSP